MTFNPNLSRRRLLGLAGAAAAAVGRIAWTADPQFSTPDPGREAVRIAQSPATNRSAFPCPPSGFAFHTSRTGA
ncbi:hypothetical protein [Azotobacter armeniacus]